MSIHYNQGVYTAIICGQEIVETDYGVQLAIKILPDSGEFERTVFLALTDDKGRPAMSADGETNLSDISLGVIAYLGLPDGRLSRLSPEHPEHHSFNGIQVQAYCQHKKNKEGGDVERWYINTPRALPGKPVDKGGLKKLDSLFGKALKEKLKGGAPQPTEQTMTPAEAATDAISPESVEAAGDDDLPF